MVKVIIEDVDPAAIEKLEALALENGRSLQAELKHILEAAAQTQTAISWCLPDESNAYANAI